MSARAKRIGIAFLGLLAASLVPLILEVVNTWRIRYYGLAQGDGGDWIYAWRGFLGYFFYAALGWLLLGAPFAAFVPAAFLRHRGWPKRVLLGALFGPVALYLVFQLLYRRMISPVAIAKMWPFWLMAAVISTIAFVVYAALLDRDWARRCGTATHRSESTVNRSRAENGLDRL